MTWIIGAIAGHFPFLPEAIRKPAAWVSLALAALALLWAGKAIYDRSVVADHEAERAADTIEARDTAADERAADAINNAEREKELNDAIDAAPKGGSLSPAELAANCERLRKLGRIPEPCRREGGD